jgi:hypothetical protein
VTSSGGSVSGVNIFNCWGSTTQSGGSGAGLIVAGDHIDTVTVHGGVFLNNASNGVTIAGTPSNVVLDGVAVWNNCTAGLCAGVAVSGGISGFSVINSMTGCGAGPAQNGWPCKQTYGVTVAPGAGDWFAILGDRFPGDSMAGVLDQASGANTAVGDND